MDLGAVGLDGLVGGSIGCSDPETKHKWYGSGLLKQERSGGGDNTNNEDDDDEYWRSNKLPKTERNSSSTFLRSNNATLFSDVAAAANHHNQQQQMLSFSSPKSDTTNCPNPTFPYHYLPLSTSNRNNTGWGSNNMHGNGNGIGIGIRGAFTPSQWMELEQQALIYKYITANVPVPSHLLIPIKKALHSAGFSHLFRPSAVGWAGFHLGFSNSTDPEPGRCRRTDGKKWRCSRDAVVDQKYCERHMNRGRHRSRKPVEGHNGHAPSPSPSPAGTTTTTTTTTNNASSKLIHGSPSLVVPGNTPPSNTLTFAQHDPKNMHPLASSDSSPPNNISRMFMNNDKESNGRERIPEAQDALPMLPPTLELKPKENPFLIHKHQIPSYQQQSARNEFGLVTSDSLLNPSHKTITRETDSHHSLRHFIDDWPKTETDRSALSSWPESERTELSISISNDFMSSTSSPTNDKVTLSPLRLSRELDPIQMGLGVGNNSLSDSSNSSRQANWIPITWESSMGGPLGEVLNLSTTNNNNNNNHHHSLSDDQCGGKNNNSSSALNLMSDGWDNSPPLGSSPTGVLQKTAFGSLSNSSAGSSPRAENNKTQEGASLCNDLLMPAL
ncbi:hypothetical protein PIB30_044415 [Stylosanthes scabra]|uniref:Growth-regulating factor n=1 Tax=Stylosanthes scabra TaxID=79078 RepID=A0ABU6ZEL2_9FABA|nr:hypothetical protein [Stylosanthes scabra]